MSHQEAGQAIEGMPADDHDETGVGIAYESVQLFCRAYPDETIDGVYNRNRSLR
jgi:hypothetical protein